jgi:hypothetical protein
MFTYVNSDVMSSIHCKRVGTMATEIGLLTDEQCWGLCGSTTDATSMSVYVGWMLSVEVVLIVISRRYASFHQMWRTPMSDIANQCPDITPGTATCGCKSSMSGR